jgi:integrase
VAPTKVPSTPTILGVNSMLAAIRPELRAQTSNKTLHEPPIQTLLRIEQLLIRLEGKGKRPSTVLAYKKNLYALAIRADLGDPADVELAIARYKCIDPKTRKLTEKAASNNYKSKLCDCYATYCKFYGLVWEKPVYQPQPTSIQPPSKEQIEMLISSAKGALSLKIQISMETGLRPIEVQGEIGLKAKDVHPEQGTITAISVKGCNPRPPIRISPELLTRLTTYIRTHEKQPTDILFTGREKGYGESFRRARNKLAEKLNDPSIKAIRLYDLRHYYVTRQLRKTQNAEIVRQMVGHKNLNTTQKYMHLLAGTSGEWIVEGTTDKERAKQLLATDFTYQLTTPDGTMLFKKAK